MIDSFKHQWPLTKAEKDAVWSQGAIVLDTNVFLHIYRLPVAQRDRLFQILESSELEERLWVPHRVAEEFFKNRLAVIDDQIVSAKKLIATVDNGFNELFDRIDQTVRKHHPLVNRARWKSVLQKALKPLHAEYEKALGRHPASITSDDFLDRVKAIMDSRIGTPFDAKGMEETMKEAKDRFERQIPPGYEDAKRKEFDRAIGDYVVWKQMLVEMGQRKQHLVFVVDDEKADWWLRRQGQLLGPRPELRAEFTAKTGQEVDFATSERFFDWATSTLELDPQPDLSAALTEVVNSSTLARQLRKHLRREVRSSAGETTETDDEDPEALAEWFLENYEDPANSVPYESAEGGYQYYAGGPYDAQEVISDNYPDASEDAVERAVDIVSEQGGPEWVRKDDY